MVWFLGTENRTITNTGEKRQHFPEIGKKMMASWHGAAKLQGVGTDFSVYLGVWLLPKMLQWPRAWPSSSPWAQALSLGSCATVDRSFCFSELRFPHLKMRKMLGPAGGFGDSVQGSARHDVCHVVRTLYLVVMSVTVFCCSLSCLNRAGCKSMSKVSVHFLGVLPPWRERGRETSFHEIMYCSTSHPHPSPIITKIV